MGILFSCFGWGTTDDEEDEVPNRGNNQLGRGASRPTDNKASMNHQQKGHASEPEPRSASEPEPNLVSEPEPRFTSEPDPRPESKPEPRPESEPEPSLESGPEPRSTSEPDPRLESEPEPRPESEPEPELEPVLESNELITHKSSLYEDGISSRDEECPICLEGYTSENPRIITTCLHHFHLGCIYDWQERSGLCPSCLKVMEFQEMN